MDLERVLYEHAEMLRDALTGEAGFTDGEAIRFLWQGVRSLAEAYACSAATVDDDDLDATTLLGSVRGRTLARNVGLPPSKTWAGLRVIAPLVLETARHQPSPDGDACDGVEREQEEDLRLEIGFGMTLDGRPFRGVDEEDKAESVPVVLAHPIFGRSRR